MRRPRRTALCSRPALLTALATLALSLGEARAQPAGGLQVERLLEGELVVARLHAANLVDETLRERLKSGLTNRLVIDAKLTPEGFGPPLYQVQRTVKVVYDLWEDHYLVEFDGAGPSRVLRLKTLAEIDQLLRKPIRVELGSVRRCQPGRPYRADVTLTVNPISKQVLERSREMISSVPGSRGGSQSRSLFGSVARVFFNVSADHGVRVLRGLSPYTPLRPAPGKP